MIDRSSQLLTVNQLLLKALVMWKFLRKQAWELVCESIPSTPASPPVGNALDEVWMECFQQDARKRPTALAVLEKLGPCETVVSRKRLRNKQPERL